MVKRCLLTALSLLLITATAPAAEPQARLRERVDEVVALLKSPAPGKPTGRQTLDGRLRVIIQEMFDYAQVARLAVGPNWRTFSEGQKKMFAETFADFLGTVYINRIQGDYSDLAVRFTTSEKLTEKKALVRSVIHREGVETPVDYYLLKKGAEWRVYNVKIEGVSMVSNYRSQFDKILLNGSPEELIDRLEKRLTRMRSGS